MNYQMVVCIEWKFHDFYNTQILREINFADSKSAKSAFLTHLDFKGTES